MGFPRFVLLALLLALSAEQWAHLVWAYPPSLEGPVIPRAELNRVFPTSTPVSYEIGADGEAGPIITLVGRYFTEEYGAGSLRCRFHLEEGPVTVCAERIVAGCVPTASDQTGYVYTMF